MHARQIACLLLCLLTRGGADRSVLAGSTPVGPAPARPALVRPAPQPAFDPTDPQIAVPFKRLGGLRPPASPLDAPRPTVTLILHTDIVGVKTTSTSPPRLRLLDPAGDVRGVAAAAGPRPADGQWLMQLKPSDGSNGVTTVRPGDRVEVTLDGAVTAVAAPEMTATGDTAHDVVAGRVPAGVSLVFVQLYADAAWLGETVAPVSLAGLAGAGGTFEVALTGPGVTHPFDLRPGTWGHVAYADAAGDLFAVPFSPPTVTLLPAAFVALVQADAGSRPELLVHNSQGAELLHTGTAIPLGGLPITRYAVPLVQGANQDIVFYLEAGHEIELWLGGRPVLVDSVPWVLGSIDPALRSVTGLAPPGERVVVSVFLDGDGNNPANPTLTATVTADAQGTFRADFPAAALGEATTAAAVAYPKPGSGTPPGISPPHSDAVAHAGLARVPNQRIWLYGNHLSGVLPGWGTLELTQTGPDGTVLSRLTAVTDYTGAFDVKMFAEKSVPATFMPGSRIRIVPQLGSVFTLDIPALTAASDGTALTGQAPANARLAVTAYPKDPDVFAPLPYEAAHATLTGQAGADGRFSLRCPAQTADCGLHFGRLAATVGRATFILGWQAASVVIVNVTTLGVTGSATAGLPVTLTPLDAAGLPAGTPVRDVVRVLDDDRLPLWEAGLKPLYPNGLKTGDRLKVEVGDTLHDVKVLPFTFQTDVVHNTGSGTGRPLTPVVGVVTTYGDAARPGPGIGSTVIGLDGRWAMGFGGFNVKPGDDVYYYMLAGNYVLGWLDQSVDGDEPPDPTVTPTASPTTGAPPRPTGMPTTRPAGVRLFAPWVGRAAAGR